MQRIAASRVSFLDLIEKDPTVVIYGVTTAMGERASHRLTREERDQHARLKPFAAATSFGDYLPDRVVRGIVLARLTNFIEGHSATTPRIAQAVAHMLDGAPMPQVAAAGQGGAGEITALYPLFAELSTHFELEVKERGSLINGSPCAAALIADAAIAARRRLQLAIETFALSIEAFRAPLEHYDEALESLWGDKDEAAVLRALRCYLGAGGGRRNYQAPVSYRIVPRILGHAHRAVGAAERAATTSLASISDNPVYLAPDAAHPYGRCISTGGYHNAMAAPALDDLAGIWADICLLCDRHSAKLLNGHVSHLPDQLLIGRQPGQSDGRGQYRLRDDGGKRLHRTRQRGGAAHVHSRQRQRRGPGRRRDARLPRLEQGSARGPMSRRLARHAGARGIAGPVHHRPRGAAGTAAIHGSHPLLRGAGDR